MKQLLYIGRPNLGENLFATPCMELLSKQYEITLLVPEHYVFLFKKYTFLKRVLPGCVFKNPAAKLPFTTLKIINTLIKEKDWSYIYHHDEDINFLHNYPAIKQLQKYPVLHDKELDINSITNPDGVQFVSRTKKYMTKLQLLSPNEVENYDCTVRCPTFIANKPNDTIIIYQGSKEILRKLPTETIAKFVNILPEAVYLVTQETALALNFTKKNIKFISISNFVQNTLEEIIKLFETRPKVLIGPDSGLTQLATSYKIPLLWLQSRVSINSIIDSQYKNNYKVYLKPNLICKQECEGCRASSANILPYGRFKIEPPLKKFKEMECFINKNPVCLQYTEQDVEKIIRLVN